MSAVALQVNPATDSKPLSHQQFVASELRKIAEKNGGRLIPKEVYEEIRDPNHPLHKEVEWDDKVAGERYRLEQVYRMILAHRHVVFMEEEANKPPTYVTTAAAVRSFVSPISGEGFVLRKTALSDEDMRQALIRKKLTELQSWCDSVVDISELTPLRESILAGVATLKPAEIAAE